MANYIREDIVSNSCRMLANATSDVEKIAALLYAAQHIKSDECDSQSKAILFESVGSDFLNRMLLGRLIFPDIDDCPKQTYITTALTIITGFCSDPQLAGDKEMHKLIPTIFQILQDDDETALEEAFLYFKCIIQHEASRTPLLEHGAMAKFGLLYARLQLDDIIEMMLILAEHPSDECPWSENEEVFFLLMKSVANEFARDHSNRKFKLCTLLRRLLLSYKGQMEDNNADMGDSAYWQETVFRGLRDILTSRIEHRQRNPALKLAGTMLDYFGAYNTVAVIDGSKQFRLLLVHLGSIEIRMQMEDQPYEEILRNADLIISCFTILEVAVNKLLNASFQAKEKDQIVKSYVDASAAVVSTLQTVSTYPSLAKNTSEETLFIYAMIRFISLGFAHDVINLKQNDVYGVMPFIIEAVKHSYQSYRRWYDDVNDVKNNARAHKGENPPNLLEVFIPALRQLTTEAAGRQIIFGLMDLFIDCMQLVWYRKSSKARYPIIRSEETEKKDKDKKRDMTLWRDANYTIVSLFELLVETIVIQPDAVQTVPQFSEVFSFILKMLPHIDRAESQHLKPLFATTSVLGLLLINHRKNPPEENDGDTLTVVKSALSFIKRYYGDVRQCTDSVYLADGPNVTFWVDFKELWLLGMQIVRRLRVTHPWIKSIVEAELAPSILDYDGMNLNDTRIAGNGPQ